MIILKKNLRQRKIKIKVTSNDDLWVLSHIIDKEDNITGSTERKIKIGEEPNIKVVRKRVFLSINVEKVEYEPENHSLRLLGKITKGPDDISLGSYHSFNLSINDEIEIEKDWAEYQIKKLEDSIKIKERILIILFDREDCIFAQLNNNSIKILSEMKGEVNKKQYESSSKNFWKEISKKIMEIDEREKYAKIILASPSFWKEYLMKEIDEDLKKKIIGVSASDVNKSNIKEVIENSKESIRDLNSVNETLAVQEVMNNISNDLGAYGYEDVKEKVNIGAVKKLVVTENFIKSKKEKEEYKEIDSLLKQAESINSEIIIVSEKEASKQLEGLGGIAGTLRWKA
ncbi:MAG: hypothetical protein ACMXX7_02985 [Candidatus Woesearchaeota archaeon]